MTTHQLKAWPKYFSAVARGEKPFEVRKNDREFAVGDRLILQEFRPGFGFTGAECVRDVTYVLPGGQFGLSEGFVVMGLSGPDDDVDALTTLLDSLHAPTVEDDMALSLAGRVAALVARIKAVRS
jgi:hypothetical protein